ncbi:hypothetical protein B7486_62650 [cyanobacterium TDX16]|nr:hypothetical protein B7486_62650 [cyanobacterium TDX16]
MARRNPGAERGAALVEMALVLPVLLVVLTGIIDFGLVLSDQISLRQGVREGARQAVVADFGSACSASGADAASRKLICLTEDRTDVDDVSVRIQLDPSNATNPSVGQGVIVCAAAPMQSISGLWSVALDDRYLTSETQMRVEVAADASGAELTTYGDADPTGEGWAWCG